MGGIGSINIVLNTSAVWRLAGRLPSRLLQNKHRPDMQRTPYCTNNSEFRDIIATYMLTESARSTNLAVDKDFVNQFAPWAPACTCQ
jgi:hypothetical protein